MTVQKLYQNICQELKKAWPESYGFEASQLLQQACGTTREDLLLGGEHGATPQQLQHLEELVARRVEGEPLQYLLGEWEFFGLPFQVGEGVLVPRGDTETIVETALTLLTDWPQPVIADLCSGSGAIAMALYHNLPQAKVYGVELSPQALPYLRANIRALTEEGKPSVEVIEGDVLTGVSLPKLDMIVSNPPYIPWEELPTLAVDVQREPKIALDGGEDGLLFYREIVRQYRDNLLPGGYMVFEVGYNQAGQVEELLTQGGFVEVSSVLDLAGIARCVHGRWPQ